MLLAKLMEEVGLPYKIAADGKQGVQMFQEWHPHLIFMDRRMPVMDGMDATRSIRRLPDGKAVKIIAVTASVFTEQHEEMLAAGMDEVVRKPYRFNEIYDCLTKQLGIEFIRENVQQPEQEAAVKLTPEMLAVLPQALRTEMRSALESLDSERILKAVQQVEMLDPELHRMLGRMVENFDYPGILAALENRSVGIYPD